MNGTSSKRTIHDLILDGIYNYNVPSRTKKANARQLRQGAVKPLGSRKTDSFIDVFHKFGLGKSVHIADVYDAYYNVESGISVASAKSRLDRSIQEFNLAKRGFVIVKGLFPNTKRMIVDDGSFVQKRYSNKSPRHEARRKEREEQRLRDSAIDKWTLKPDNPEDSIGLSQYHAKVLGFL